MGAAVHNRWHRFRIRSGLVAALCTTLLFASRFFLAPVWAALWAHPYFEVTQLSIRGAGPLLSNEEIRAWLGVGQSPRIWELSPTRVRQRLELHPLIARASVRREFPNRLDIAVQERAPEAIVSLDRLYYLGRGGAVLKALDREHDPDLPLITGLSTEVAAGYRAAALRRAQRLLRLCDRMSCFGGVSEVNLDPERGVVLYPMHPRVAVVLGWGSWREKLRRAERVLAAWVHSPDALAAIDLRFRGQVVVRPRQPLPVSKSAKPGARA